MSFIDLFLPEKKKCFAYILVIWLIRIADYATKDQEKMTLFHGSLFSKNEDRKLMKSETWAMDLCTART